MTNTENSLFQALLTFASIALKLATVIGLTSILCCGHCRYNKQVANLEMSLVIHVKFMLNKK